MSQLMIEGVRDPIPPISHAHPPSLSVTPSVHYRQGRLCPSTPVGALLRVGMQTWNF